MTPQRAQEIIDNARAHSVGFPWVDQIKNELLPGEREQVNAVWDTLPGHTHFVNALEHIARGDA